MSINLAAQLAQLAKLGFGQDGPIPRQSKRTVRVHREARVPYIRQFDRRGARTQPGLAPTCDSCASPQEAGSRPWRTFRGMVLCPECRDMAEESARASIAAAATWHGCDFQVLIGEDLG